MHSRGGPWAVSRIETSREGFSGREDCGEEPRRRFLVRGRRIGEEDGREEGFGFSRRLVRGGALYRLWGGRGIATRFRFVDSQ